MKKILYTLAAFSVSLVGLPKSYGQRQFSLSPFGRSLFFNQNVYKTQDSLDLLRVYDASNQLPIADSVIYRLSPSMVNGNFLRYALLNDSGDNTVVILKGTRFVTNRSIRSLRNPAQDSVRYIVYDPNEGNSGPHDFYFKIKPEKPTPPQKYLATQHITGLPVTIPIKIRFNVPSTQSPVNLNLNIGYAFGYKIRATPNPYKEKYVRFLVITGVGTETYLATDSVQSKTYKGEASVTWFYGWGVTYEVGNRFNVGAFVGADQMFGNKKDWYYQKKAWLGVGFGYKF